MADSLSDSLTTVALGIIYSTPGYQYEVYSVYILKYSDNSISLTLDELWGTDKEARGFGAIVASDAYIAMWLWSRATLHYFCGGEADVHMR